MVAMFPEISRKLNLVAFYIFNGIVAIVAQPAIYALAFQIGSPQLILIYFPADVMIF